jgi:hypothetical protein
MVALLYAVTKFSVRTVAQVVPTGQSTQLLAEFARLNLPVAQIAQSVIASWADATIAASARKVPTRHCMQVLAAIAPVAVLYFPDAHIVQSDSSSWDETVIEESERKVPAGHEMHVVDACCPVASLYLPASQIVQSASSS